MKKIYLSLCFLSLLVLWKLRPIKIERLFGLPDDDDYTFYSVAVDNFDKWNETDVDNYVCSIYMNSDTLWGGVAFYKYGKYVNAKSLKEANDDNWTYYKYANPDAFLCAYGLYEASKFDVFLLQKGQAKVFYNGTFYPDKPLCGNKRVLTCAKAIKEKYKNGGFKVLPKEFDTSKVHTD